MSLLDYWAAFLMGVAGSGHCIAMCGGFACAMGYQQSKLKIVLYNFGRITSYMIAGALIATAFFGITQIRPHAFVWMRIAAGVMMILLALYLLRLSRSLIWLERIGAVLWRRIQPLSKRFTPQSGKPSHIYLAGMIWGWLPCGLVYSALSWAALSANPWSGATFMFLFGLGTLPSMLLLGMLSFKFKEVLQSSPFRWLSSLLLIGYGVATLVIGLMQLS